MMRMKQTRPLALLTLTVCLLSACSTASRRAPIIDRAHAPVATRPAAPVVVEEPKEETRSSYVVKRGDTLLRIALDHGLNYRDVVSWNRLANPDDIKVDQVLRLTAPEHGTAIQTAPVTMPEIRPAAPKKTGPRGEKKPYSDAALADAKKDDDGKPDARPEAKVEKASVATTGVAAGSIVKADDDEKLSWMWPSDGKIVATFDEGKNKGIDIAGKMGQQVMAAGSGKVMYAGSGIRGYGKLVMVKHSNSLLSAYAHNRAILVKEGQNVTKGQAIAEMGDSDADTVKLHFEIRQQGKPVDPAKFLPSR
jgi:lipoprotein NlpD